MPHKILVAQGGGPTAVINQSLAGVALEARRFPASSHVYGALHGVRGHRQRRSRRSRPGDAANLETVAATPAAALGSTRDKPDLKYCQEIFKVLKAHAHRLPSSISAATIPPTRCASSPRKRRNPTMGFAAIHIPKTIDNDLVGYDHTPGYPSAARFVAQAFAGANLDNRR